MKDPFELSDREREALLREAAERRRRVRRDLFWAPDDGPWWLAEDSDEEWQEEIEQLYNGPRED